MRFIPALFILSIVCACSNQGLVQVGSTSSGPDEFVVEPKKELVVPGDLNDLPPPTPGQTNRADTDPKAEMIVALGGRPGNANAPVPSADRALVNAASRYGVSPDIRQSLAQEDADFRRGKSRFTQFRLFPTNLYLDVYEEQALDPSATAESWRRAGARTPSYPPTQ